MIFKTKSMTELSRLMKYAFISIALLLLIISSPIYAAQNTVVKTQSADLLAPPDLTKPTNVFLTLHINDISDISMEKDVFTAQGRIEETWADKRLQFKPISKSNKKKYAGAKADMILAKIWHPDLRFENSLLQRDTLDRQVIIFANGTVKYFEDFNVVLRADFQLKKFPFDSQILPISIRSSSWETDIIQLSKQSKFTHYLQTHAWDVDNVSYKISEINKNSYSAYSQLAIKIKLDRNYHFHIMRVLLTLNLIVLAACVIFWVWPNSPMRVPLLTSGLFVIVVFMQIHSGYAPKVGYTTFMDAILVVPFFWLITTIVESLISDHFRRASNKHTSTIDRYCRWLFPGIYVLAMVLTVAYYFH